MQGNVDTILGEDIDFRGKLHFKKNLKINGRFRGKIQTGGHLIVGSTAHVEADIEASQVSIEGEVQGNVIASKKIGLKKNSRMKGDLRTPDLEIESGSQFTGSCIMD